MAGKRQHYIPKFLQRQFLARDHPPEKGECVWWHFRGNPAKPLEISHIGVEEYFYSRLRNDGIPTLDDRITAQEIPIQEDMAFALAAHPGKPVNAALAGRLVAHFVLRTAFIRATFADAATAVINRVVATVGTTEGARAHLGIDAVAVSPHVAGIVASVSQALAAAMAPIPPQWGERFVRYILRERFDEFMGDLDTTIATVQAKFVADLSETVASAHKKVLGQDEATAWETRLAGLNWQMHPVDGAVLPDCIAIARAPGRAWAPLLLVGIEELDACIFPIADNRLLVGTRSVRTPVDLEEINAACAACSDEFFIAAVPLNHLGTTLGMRTAEVIRREIDDALDQARGRPAENRTGLLDAPLRAEVPVPFEYTLNYPSLDDPAHEQSLQHLIRLVVYEMSRTSPLEALDDITFAEDYPAASARLNRDDATLPPDLSEPRAYGIPVAKAVAVRRDGQQKRHLVFGWGIAAGLLADQEGLQRASLQTVVTMLAHLAHEAIYLDPLARTRPTFPDAFTQHIHQASASAPGYYYTHRLAAYAAPAAGPGYATLFRDCVAAAQDSMASAHARFANDGAVDPLLQAGLTHARHLLDHAAQWCGHVDGLTPEEAADDACTGQAIMDDAVGSRGLMRWLALLHADLRELYASPHSFTADRIFGLARHAERMLWAFRVCPWPLADGGIYVSVPDSGGFLG